MCSFVLNEAELSAAPGEGSVLLSHDKPGESLSETVVGGEMTIADNTMET